MPQGVHASLGTTDLYNTGIYTININSFVAVEMYFH